MARKKKAPEQKFPDGIVVAVRGQAGRSETPAYVIEYMPEFHDDEEGPYMLTDLDRHGSFHAHEAELRAVTGAEAIALLRELDARFASDRYPVGSSDWAHWADDYEKSDKPHYGFKVAPWVKDKKAPKARTKRKKGSAARPHFEKSAQELCAIGDKACREELRLRGRDPKTGRKLHWG